MIKTMTIGPYVLNGSKILFMKRNLGEHSVNIYFDNYEFVLASNGISIKSLFNVCGSVRDVDEGQFYIFVTDENGKGYRFDSDEPDFADRIVDLFRAV